VFERTGHTKQRGAGFGWTGEAYAELHPLEQQVQAALARVEYAAGDGQTRQIVDRTGRILRGREDFEIAH